MRGVEVLFSLLFLMCFLGNEPGLQIAEAEMERRLMGQSGLGPAARLGICWPPPEQFHGSKMRAVEDERL